MRFRMALLSASLAFAACAPATGRPRVQRAIPPPVLASEVSLENRRGTPLLNFEIVMPGRDKSPEIVVGKIEKPLASGAATTFPLQGASGCAFEARWAFGDNIRDASDIDLCNDAHIVLVD